MYSEKETTKKKLQKKAAQKSPQQRAFSAWRWVCR
jgi:hypothetical protein